MVGPPLSVLDAPDQDPEATPADLYDPLTMPAPMRRAYNALDKAVDRCKLVPSEESRVETIKRIFAMYVQERRGFKAIAGGGSRRPNSSRPPQTKGN